MRRRDVLMAGASVALAPLVARAKAARRYLYVAQPGIRNYQQYGGVGVLVYDIDDDFRFVRRIPTWAVADGKEAVNVKGVAANARTGRLWVTSITRLICIDLKTDRVLWDVAPDGGCDRLSVSPDGRALYVPSFEGPHWNVVDGLTGRAITTLKLDSKAHNTLWGPKGRRVYLEGLASPYLSIADAKTHTIVGRVGPFSASIRPFTVNAAETLAYVNVNDRLGFEVGDIRTGKVLHQVDVQGVQKGPVARHGCPSHGIGLTPDEKELWVCDGHNSALHVFDTTVMPPRQVASLKVRDQPGWVTFSLDGRLAFPSTGEVFDVVSKRLVKALQDETGRQIGSEKLVEIQMSDSEPVACGDQFGVGRRVSK